MCTAFTYKTKCFYFGRTLDYEVSFAEQITLTPREFPLMFRHTGCMDSHFGILGMASVQKGYPLYYDAMNDKGLAMAALNFVGNAHYQPVTSGKDNVTHFELIPWILGQCQTVQQALKLLRRICITDTPFGPELPPAQLHWLIADRREAITVEAMEDGLHIYPNPVGVLTNNPPFPMQLQRLNDYMGLSSDNPRNTFSKKMEFSIYSRGMGALGLPGDLSSGSRFIRGAFVKENSLSGTSEPESVNQFFHILTSVEQQRGCCQVGPGEYEITLYASCCNTDKGIYYVKTYGNHQICAVDMHKEDVQGTELMCFPLITGEQIRELN